MPGFAYETVATRVVRQMRIVPRRVRDGWERLRRGQLPEEIEAALARAGIPAPQPRPPVVEMGEPSPLLERLWRQALFSLAVALFLLSLGALTLFAVQLLASYLLLTRGLGLRLELNGRPA